MITVIVHTFPFDLDAHNTLYELKKKNHLLEKVVVVKEGKTNTELLECTVLIISHRYKQPGSQDLQG